MTIEQKNLPWKKAIFLTALIALATLSFSLFLPVRAAVTITVPYNTTPVVDGDLDGYPNTGAWGDALSTTIPLENGAASPYGTATLYIKHDGTNVYYRIDGSIDVLWESATGNHFWLGMEVSRTGTSHHSGSGWDGIFFGLWDGTDYSPAPTYPPTPVDTNGFGKPPAKDATQNVLGAMRYSGSAKPYSFTAEWKKALNTGDSNDIALVADGTTTYNFFVTTDTDGKGSSGGNLDHSKITNLNTMKLASAPPPVVHDVAITGVTASPTTVTQGGTVAISVNAANQGTQSETFDVTAYYDSTSIGTQSATLGAGGSTTLTFSWVTTGVTPGTYTIKAVASSVPSEIDTADNTLIDGTVTVNAPVIHDVAITTVSASTTTVTVGQTVSVTVGAANQGGATETFTVTTYYDSTAVGVGQQVTLSSGGSTTLTFSWDTTGVAAGSYTVKAVASTVPGETDLADNTLVDGTVTVKAAIVHDVAITGVSASPTTVTVGQIVSVAVDVQNQGTQSESFTATAYYDSSAIGTQSITLSAGATTSISFSWNTTGVAAGTYTIRAVASTVPSETDTTDNTFIDATVTVQPLVKFGELAKKSAWPEHHHFDQSAEQARGEDLINTLYAIVKKDSLSDKPVAIQVVFAIYKDGVWVANVTAEFTLTYAGQEKTLEAYFDTSGYGTGKYSVTAQIWYDSDCNGTIDKAGETKKFGFAVVT